jgi:hypothetical protein
MGVEQRGRRAGGYGRTKTCSEPGSKDHDVQFADQTGEVGTQQRRNDQAVDERRVGARIQTKEPSKRRQTIDLARPCLWASGEGRMRRQGGRWTASRLRGPTSGLRPSVLVAEVYDPAPEARGPPGRASPGPRRANPPKVPGRLAGLETGLAGRAANPRARARSRPSHPLRETARIPVGACCEGLAMPKFSSRLGLLTTHPQLRR